MSLGSRFTVAMAFVAGSGLVAPAMFGQTPSAAQAQVSSTTSIVGGSIFDSTITRPLENATVQLASRSDVTKGPSFTAMTDASGFFRFPAVPPGEYLITFFHSRLDELGLVGAVKPVTVLPGGARIEIELGIPGARRLYAIFCGPKALSDSSGVLLGSITSAADGSPIEGASVTAQWFELTMGSKGLIQSRPAIRAKTTAEGRFALCRVPWDTKLAVWATAGKAMTGTIEAEVKPYGVATAELLVDVADTVRSDTATTRRGTARLAGIVRGPNGQPLPGARVGLDRTFAEATADERGAYQLGGLPAGTQTLMARAIGYVPIIMTVNLYPNRAVTKDVAFGEAAQVLETVDVQAKTIYSRSEQEFLAAKKGMGYFIDAEQIERRQPFRTSDLLRMAPGVTINQGGGLGDETQIQIRGAATLSGPCAPMLVVDGMRLEGSSGDIDQITRPENIQGMAIYRGPSETPVEYQGFNSCGAIVIWTKRGGPRAPKRSTSASPARPSSRP